MGYIKYFFIFLLSLYSAFYMYNSFFEPEISGQTTVGLYIFFTAPIALILIGLSIWGFYKTNLYLKVFSAVGLVIGVAMLAHEPLIHFFF